MNYAFAASLVASSIVCLPAQADDAATASALRIAGTVTGGLMPTTAPEFAQMLAATNAGDYYGAALIAAKSSYCAKYLARRLARQMQNPGLDASVVSDNDATTFLVAHFVGASPSISTVWSENATYLVKVIRGGNPVNVHAKELTATELSAVDWRNDLVRVAGQSAKDRTGNNPLIIAIPQKHVGGYATLSDRTDGSLASYGLLAGTNLRFIESIYEIAFGITLTEAASTDARIQDVPRFVPSYDPNFLRGTGQPACISCHGGGLSSLNHGYSTVGNTFDFTTGGGGGIVYFASPTPSTMKSLASDPNKRNENFTCNLDATPKPVCNPDSVGADPNQAWDVQTTWKDSGLLARFGWKGAVTGAGLNSLGVAIGQASGVYAFLTKRVINEICPRGSILDNELAAVAANGQSADDLRVMIAGVASHPSCR